MEIDLAGKKGGIPERFVPDEDVGQLIEAEHIARYRWASQAADKRKVLDAGCGAAYGAKMLAGAGALEVVGVDIAEAVLEVVRPTMPPTVRLDTGDLRKLPYDDDTFDLVVCFEVIEHLEDPFPVLDQLVRVLTPDGLLLISSPNRGIYPALNPHHYHEFRPDELESALSERLTNVRLVRQHNYLVSALLSDDVFLQAPSEPLDEISLHKLAFGDPNGETFTIAMASNDDLPHLRQLAAMTATLELRHWFTLVDEQNTALREHSDYIAQLEERIGDRDRIEDLLVEAERHLACVPDLELRIADLERELEEARRAAEIARDEVRVLDERVTRGQRVLADVFNSPSWRLTKPLRMAKQLLRRG